MNYSQNINLLKLRKAAVMNIQGSKEMKLCVVIPVDENDIFLSADDNLKPKAAYLNVIAWETKEPSGVDKFGNTHGLKQSFSKEFRERHEEELKESPFLGSMKRFERMQPQVSAQQTASAYAINDNDDLPF